MRWLVTIALAVSSWACTPAQAQDAAVDPPSVGVGGRVSVFTAEPQTLEVVQALERATVEISRCYDAVLRRPRSRGTRGIVRIRLPVGASRLTAEGPALLVPCARRLLIARLSAVRAVDFEASLVFTPGRHRRVVLGPVSGTLEPASLAAIEAAIHARLAHVEQLGAQTAGGGRPRLRVRMIDGRVMVVSGPDEASDAVREWAAVFGRALTGLEIAGLPAGAHEVLLAVQLTPPRPGTGDPLATLDCQAPIDCPDRIACVTGAMGGGIGCTGETCCGGDECSNGCLRAADCPRCRPTCTARGGAPGFCR